MSGIGRKIFLIKIRTISIGNSNNCEWFDDDDNDDTSGYLFDFDTFNQFPVRYLVS